ncbi:MAG: hypothetical protein ACXAC7_19515 [Candidatus Hodarchaeales archaeon]|jgi:hypothetical protein
MVEGVFIFTTDNENVYNRINNEELLDKVMIQGFVSALFSFGESMGDEVVNEVIMGKNKIIYEVQENLILAIILKKEENIKNLHKILKKLFTLFIIEYNEKSISSADSQSFMASEYQQFDQQLDEVFHLTKEKKEDTRITSTLFQTLTKQRIFKENVLGYAYYTPNEENTYELVLSDPVEEDLLEQTNTSLEENLAEFILDPEELDNRKFSKIIYSTTQHINLFIKRYKHARSFEGANIVILVWITPIKDESEERIEDFMETILNKIIKTNINQKLLNNIINAYDSEKKELKSEIDISGGKLRITTKL